MKKALITTLFLLFSLACISQLKRFAFEVSIPVFAELQDSVHYASSSSLWSKIYAETFPIKGDARKDTVLRKHLMKMQDQMDSLGHIMRDLSAKAIGHKTMFYPRFTDWDTLAAVDRAKVRQLSLHGKKVQKIPREILRCKELETLELVDCSVRKLRSLRKLTHLTQVNIYNNNIRFPLIIRRNQGIKELKVRSESSTGSPKSYRKLKGLRKLDLSNTGITRFPNIARNKALTNLWLTHNHIDLATLPSKNQPSLIAIDLLDNGIEHVPDAIGNFSSLLSLSLSNNKVKTISNGIKNLKKLEALVLYGNELTAIPEVVYELKSLRHLDLYYNNLTSFDNRITKLQNLSELHLAHNELRNLPDSIGSLARLQGLYVNNNHIYQLPESVAAMTDLKELLINGNYLSLFPPQVSALQKLTWLDISRNEIKTIPREIFDRPGLMILSIYGNPWTDVMRSDMTPWIERMRAKNQRVLTSPPENEVN